MNNLLDFLNSEYDHVELYHTSEFNDELYFNCTLNEESYNVIAVLITLDNGEDMYEVTQSNSNGHRSYVGSIEA